MGVMKHAEISECGKYRWMLSREWNLSLPTVCWVMLNPSTADASIDDPTIRKCIQFAKSWNCGSLIVVNLFAYRATIPTDMKKVFDPVGGKCDEHISNANSGSDFTVFAWGKYAGAKQRSEMVTKAVGKGRFFCLGKNINGSPKHPLYLSIKTPLIPFYK